MLPPGESRWVCAKRSIKVKKDRTDRRTDVRRLYITLTATRGQRNNDTDETQTAAGSRLQNFPLATFISEQSLTCHKQLLLSDLLPKEEKFDKILR